MTEAIFRENKLHDIAFLGLRATIGTIFLVAGSSKFNPGFVDYLTGQMGLPAELQIPIALAETIGGVLLILGIISRISASLLSIIMLGAIFYVKGASNFSGQGAYQYDLLLLAISLVIIVAGPGRMSISHIIKKIPRYLH